MKKESASFIRAAFIKYKALALELCGLFLLHTGFWDNICGWVDKFQLNCNGSKRPAFPFIKRRLVRSFQILMYHGIDGAPTPFLPTLGRKAFENQMEYLSSHCQVIGLDEIVARMKERDIPERAVVLTFDDGYRSVYKHAFPILKKYGISATCFLPTEVIGTGRVLWHDYVCWAISVTKKSVLLDFGGYDRDTLTTEKDKEKATERILWYLRSLEDQQRNEEIERLGEKLAVANEISASDLMLTWEQVWEMHQEGICFGAHTVTHPILSKLPIDKALQEIRQSRKIIQDHIPTQVTTFAYPSGRAQDFTPGIKDLVRDEGFLCAVSTIQKSNVEGTDPFELGRIGYWDTKPGSFGVRFEYYQFL